MSVEDEQRRACMRSALERLKEIMREEGTELIWIEQRSGFDLYVNDQWDSWIGLDELAWWEAWMREQE